MADGNITIAVESVIHKTLADTLQRIWAEHGIRIDSVHADWTDVSPVHRHAFLLERIDVRSISFPQDGRGA